MADTAAWLTRAQASNAGDSAVVSEAVAIGGRGGSGTQGTRSWAAATGSSSGGGHVTLIARQIGGEGGAAGPWYGSAGNGGDSFTDGSLVSGTTSGVLTLKQEALGGNGGSGATGWGSAGKGGRANSTLGSNDSHSLLVEGESRATGGVGGKGGELDIGGEGGEAVAGISVFNDGEIFASAIAQGGVGGSSHEASGYGGNGASAGITGAYGSSSQGQTVSVSAEAIGGDGGWGKQRGGSGASVNLYDAVNGRTTGELILSQAAKGGNGGASEGQGGGGGFARSFLTASTNEAASLTVHSAATGGDSYETGYSNSATAFASGTSSSGRLKVESAAQGGRLLSEGSWAWDPRAGDAEASAQGVTYGDDHDVTVRADATGGDSSTNATGGRAESRATGTAQGDSAVSVYSVAVAGAGSRWDDVSARSNATASNAGNSMVAAVAHAMGGKGSISGGAARAEASASSSGGGAVFVQATQAGGDGLEAGADSLMADQVSGSTTGSLALSQIAIGGDGIQPGAGRGGRAESRLMLNDSSASDLNASVHAYGGQGQAGQTWQGTAGGAAETYLSLSGSGSVTASGAAFGGSGGINGAGGGARNEIVAYSSGQGAVTVSGLAVGGSPEEFGGQGGGATSRSRGIGNGSGEVKVSDSATVGAGYHDGTTRATSEARANSNRNGKVSALSTAIGPSDYGYFMSSAHSDAGAASEGGDTLAVAKSKGGSSEAYATADSWVHSGPVRKISARNDNVGVGDITSVARTSFGGDASLAAAANAFSAPDFDQASGTVAQGIGVPATEAVQAALAGHAEVAQALSGGEVLGLGLLGNQVVNGQEHQSSSLTYYFDPASFSQGAQHLMIGFTSVYTGDYWHPRSGFSLAISMGGVSVFEQTYTDEFMALESLSDLTLDLGSWDDFHSNDLQFTLSSFGDEPWHPFNPQIGTLAFNFVIANAPSAVPVPAAAWLLGSGLLGLVGLRRRRTRG